MKRIYVAGPYTGGEVIENVRKAVRAGDQLMDMGYAPFIPHLSHFAHFLEPRPYQDWLDMDLAWVAACDAVLRLPGKSPGADKELLLADDLGIHVCYSLDELQALYY